MFSGTKDHFCVYKRSLLCVCRGRGSTVIIIHVYCELCAWSSRRGNFHLVHYRRNSTYAFRHTMETHRFVYTNTHTHTHTHIYACPHTHTHMHTSLRVCIWCYILFRHCHIIRPSHPFLFSMELVLLQGLVTNYTKI